ncbi:class I SAM-dependent methyltransferase [Candidatus Woesearchaeota archaeon]|nr:class I SAM-dependent methyltransferase [Candidatus Woesearchaeota archaeon]
MTYKEINEKRNLEVQRFVNKLTRKVYEKFVNKRPCPVCESENNKAAFTKEGFDHVICLNCKMFFTPNFFKKTVLNDFYNGEYYNKTWQFKSKYDISLKFKRKYFTKIAKLIEKYKKPGSVLDIGCGTGDFLNVMKKRGWDTFGTELNSYARDFVKKKYNINTNNLDLEKFEPEKYDLISMSQLIEHIPNPKKLLLQAHRVLKNKGILFLAFPNRFGISIIIKGKNAGRFKGGEHINFFSKETITKLLNETGFKVKHTSSVKIDLYGLLRHLFKNIKKENNLKEITSQNKISIVEKKSVLKKIPGLLFYEILTPLCSKLVGIFGCGEDLIVIAEKK